ncbi:response regulator receiver domain-containing protein [Coprinopsis cinerea okayama7|uniref:Response regulator receiver domain-containing protein n=1 Tax=Coprinopsis cinerea (strain Okayama-7 / 130 / ATCC MYA-4618 / FGSC 9003) TaxID=240176 RepID=A8PGR8_COPC7|nr:response regulator receiver domain-containing protein [Coprinopsis cinerea okayama7\|eukprot:XP_001841264.1 response regulator receiver domain-containing protein [Coprinopsis cinerea okayama7\
MPLPSQLSQLQHPHKQPSDGSPTSATSTSLTPASSNNTSSSPLNELSFELADSIQMVVQTLLQVSPPQVLDITKEQFSACSLSVPTSSMSAMFTVMKNINYLSANMPTYFDEMSAPDSKLPGKRPAQSADTYTEFDIGEMLQCIGDSLGGTAAQVGVDMVIFHGDVSLKHVNVVGDEAALSYAISHVIRQVLNIAERGDTVELGLLLTPTLQTQAESSSSMPDIPLQCTIRVSHKFAFPERLPNDPYGPEPQQVRQHPNFSSLLLRRILRHTSGSIKGDLPPPENFSTGRTVELAFPLRRPRSTQAKTPNERANSEEPQFAHDPTLRQLVSFAETLKGKKVTLHASPKACFAQHLTSYLTAWGMDVTHVSPDGDTDGTSTAEQTPAADGAPATGEGPNNPDPVSFVFIDDDVDVLKERLLAQRSGFNPFTGSQALSKKRPTLANLHRPRSTVNVPHNTGITKPANGSNVIMHFTSLANYKHLKDVVQSMMAGFSAATIPLPEVMIIPKPAGPRRFLTALHTAATKPSVDLPFIPIATSPLSPGLATGTFFGSYSGNTEQQPHSKINASQPVSPTKPLRPTGSRTNSERSLTSSRESESSLSQVTPSPLSLPENVEYFDKAAASKLGSNPSSGIVVKSPDGQTGILFRPKTKVPRSPQERDKGQLVVPSRRSSRSSPNGNAEGLPSFGTMYSATQSAASSPVTKPKGQNGAASESSLLHPLDKDRIAAATLAGHPPPPLSAPLGTPVSTVATPVKSSDSKTPASKGTSPTGSPRPQEAAAAMRRRQHLRKASSDKDATTTTTTPLGKKGKAPDNSIIPPISVLIVDDNPINQTILSTFMKRKRISYDIANNGEEAVTKWRVGNFHLILMDIQMPIMDGIQATKEIRRMEKANALAGYPPLTPNGEGQRTPSDTSSVASRATASPYRSSVIIVALTASSLQSDRDAALAAGCNDFLTKPVSLLWLNNKIIEWGSIKALQVWADLRPDVNRMNTGQAAQARAVADRLQVPKKKTASPPPRRSSSLNKEEGAAALALASPAGVPLKESALGQFTSEPKSLLAKIEGGKEISPSRTPSGDRTSSSTETRPSRTSSVDSTTDDESINESNTSRSPTDDEPPRNPLTEPPLEDDMNPAIPTEPPDTSDLPTPKRLETIDEDPIPPIVANVATAGQHESSLTPTLNDPRCHREDYVKAKRKDDHGRNGQTPATASEDAATEPPPSDSATNPTSTSDTESDPSPPTPAPSDPAPPLAETDPDR